MRIFYFSLLFIIVAIFFLAAYGIINICVSIKYEIEPYILDNTVTPTVLEKAGLYHSLILSNWVIIGFCILTFVLIIDKLRKFPPVPTRI
jgi:hypothetical protein